MITKFKIFESDLNNNLFKNENELKELLIKDKYFAEGEIFQALVNIGYGEGRSHNEVVDWISDKFGELPVLCILLGIYASQVYNGGHYQYFDNGYASSGSFGTNGHYNDIENHEELVYLFETLGIVDLVKKGKEAFNVINNFELEFGDDIETCTNCGGSGTIECYDCGGSSEVNCVNCGGSGENADSDEDCGNCNGDGITPCETCDGEGETECEDCGGSGDYVGERDVIQTRTWDKLDEKWYDISEEFLEEFDKYVKGLNLDGEKISELIKFASTTKNYNL